MLTLNTAWKYDGIFVKSIQKPQVWADWVTINAHIGRLLSILIQGVDNFCKKYVYIYIIKCICDDIFFEYIKYSYFFRFNHSKTTLDILFFILRYIWMFGRWLVTDEEEQKTGKDSYAAPNVKTTGPSPRRSSQ